MPDFFLARLMEAQMLSTTRTTSAIGDTSDNGADQAKKLAAKGDAAPPAMLACFILMPKQAESLISVLKELATGATDITQLSSMSFALTADSKESVEVWLSHAEAAKYLGISKSTLYHHAEQERLESRKFCGRLEYRVCSLDKFKNEQLRPPRRSRDGAIIGPALSSGK
jgi:excisionase family DNA binding protein